ncbi:MAG: Long-chain-fatty-acid--CoA ligase [Syntrophorhabdaceae bacterium PtaU1.Bin034]|nr:MAG: Long-chain-fatty-acid--CoA ligase [Syntrophorhabdaceae bacterium PtaU1.Bin034]
MNIVDLVYRNARMYPDETAFVEIRSVSKGRGEVTWKQFNERTNSLANALIERGVRKGDRVFMMAKNSISWLEAYFGILKTGAWINPLNFRFTDDDVRYCAAAAEPSCFLFEGEYAKRMDAIRADLPTVKKYITMGGTPVGDMEEMGELIRKTLNAAPKVEITDEDECGLYFTSGTTGAPKPILLRQKNLFTPAVNEVTNLFLTKDDALLMMPPMYHVALGHLLGSMLVAAKTVLLTEAITAKAIFEAISTEKLRVAFLLVPWVLDCLEALDKGEIKKNDYDLSAWRILQMGAQPIPTSLVRRWKVYFPGMECHNTFGLSESTGPGTIHNKLDDESKIGAIGKPGLLWDARIVNDQGEDVPRGEVGEIVLKGMGVMKEYYKNPELTARTIINGWLHTGDLGKMDENGYIFLVDRQKDLVISGGENVYPVEVEEVIQKHPKVRDVAIIGTPHERLGEIVTAVIDPVDGNLTTEEITAYCEKNLPRYKRPRRIVFDAVPRSPTGKIEKPKLRAKYNK